MLTISFWILWDYSKAQSLSKAVKEREELDKLQRETRTRKSELASLKNKLSTFKFEVEKAQTDERQYSERKHQLEDKSKVASADLARLKKDLQDAEAEKRKIK